MTDFVMSSHDKEQVTAWLDKNNFCAMPFFHVAIEANGDVRPCCLGDPLRNSDGSVFNSIGMNVIDIINHPTHKAFRDTFARNERHPACNVCWGEYQNDKFSGRYTYSSSAKVHKEMVQIMNGKAPEQKLVWLEIKAGNRCNLACRICGLWNSAKWLKETYNLRKLNNANYPDFKNSQELAYNNQAKWIDNVEFWKNVDGFEDIKIIHLMGGEPLMIEEHYEMLKAIAERFDPSEIIIWYNTNGTVIPTSEQEALLFKFKKILWSVSIDDFGDKFDYQRSGANWLEVKQNLPYFFSKDKYLSNIDATINVHNIVTIHEFIKELDSMNLSQHFLPHFVTTPNGIYNIRTLHTSIKEKIKSVLLEHKPDMNSNCQARIDDIINFMVSIDAWSDKIDERRKREIAFIDKERGEHFVKVFPEMAELLGYE